LLGLYLHIPFCSAICNYCNFNRGLFDEPLKTRYVAALTREILQSPYGGRPVDTVFFGGGTGASARRREATARRSSGD